ncbi:carbohydrate binding domain-containing protein [Hymenobacter terricola]|uniref:carbohydrate binding domain-containing protein n=1 Tax=Hymenobacter terricola TaxID=2819236 RepID=UPI001B316C77|nr:carbohydrate binding domain-containing protein [Hymenobacter terricola]
MKTFFYSLFFFALASCSNNSAPANQLAANDFESVDGWTGDAKPASLTKEKSHSGHYSVKVAPGVDFGMGFNNTLSVVSSSRLKKIKVHAWVWLPGKSAAASLVTQITDPAAGNKSIMWQGLDLANKVKSFGKWVEIEQEYAIPAEAAASHRLYCYLWRGSSPNAVYIDDLQILNAE